jgi:hypothetical protein
LFNITFLIRITDFFFYVNQRLFDHSHHVQVRFFPSPPRMASVWTLFTWYRVKEARARKYLLATLRDKGINTSNVRINVILMRVRITIVAMEQQ